MLCLVLTSSCSGGGGTNSGDAGAGFQLTRISVTEASPWEINRPIELVFSDEVNFSSVSLNSINIAAIGGAPATGTFFFKAIDLDGDGSLESVDPRVVVFQPTCPTLADLSDAGLQPGGVSYRLTVLGESSTFGNTVQSTRGEPLRNTQTRTFTTPASSQPQAAFIDTVNGPPTPVIRLAGASDQAATYLELGADDGNRVYFELDLDNQTIDTNPSSEGELGFRLPLNLFSDSTTSVAVVIEFNQAVGPSELNLSGERLGLEFLDGAGVWRPIETEIELLANCTETGGARVRLAPIGILPAASSFRVVIRQGFTDIVGESRTFDLDDFAVAPTRTSAFESLTPADDNADGLIAEFNFPGSAVGSFEDSSAIFPSTNAEWGGGELRSAFSFVGTGGNANGDFDWVIGEIGNPVVMFFDTTSTTITGGPGGVITDSQTALNGFVDVRNLIIQEGSTLRVQGPNAMVVSATGRVEIRGTLDISGIDAKNVATLGTGAQAEIGGAGVGGGGRGGNASEVLNDSTRRGGTGFGAFGVANAGGLGGESGFSPEMSVDSRRPGNGGGGAFGEYVGVSKRIVPESGKPGAEESTGCLSGLMPAQGGAAGSGPFVNNDLDDNVFGIRPITDGAGNLVELRRGELTRLWAGAGGGGGGDALPAGTCPSPNWVAGSDEKGGGGGGGGGGLRISALGPIVFGSNGQILAEGGQGAIGENTINTNHIGGSGGGGSGGHVLLESATQIDFTDGNPAGAPARAYISVQGGLGGQGDAAFENRDGGGAGGAGVIQLHVPNPIQEPRASTSDSIVVPTAALQDPFNGISIPAALPLIQTFGGRSQARSRWVSIGGADQDTEGGLDLLTFLFSGVETEPGPDQGKVLATGGVVDEIAALLEGDLNGNPDVALDSDGVTLRLSGTALASMVNDAGSPSTDLYLRTPALLRNYLLRLSSKADPAAAFANFDVVAATYDDAKVELALTVSSPSGTPQDFLASQGASAVRFELIPRFFRIQTGTSATGLDRLDANAFVRITFDAAPANRQGEPDEQNLLITETGDISDFNALDPGDLKFFRFNVEFNLDATGKGISTTTETVALKFLGLPFRF